jgi:hypothetical protein
MSGGPFSLSIKCITRKNYTNFYLFGILKGRSSLKPSETNFYFFIWAYAAHTCTISFDGQEENSYPKDNYKEKATRGASSGNI